MDKDKILENVSLLKLQMEEITNTLAVLEKEVLDSGASGTSSRKGREEAIRKKVVVNGQQRRARQIKKGSDKT